MRVGILGPLEARRGDAEPCQLGGPRPRAVLAALALRAGRIVPAERLIDDVWGARLPAAPARTLTTVVSRIRVALGDPAWVVSDGAGYRLDLDAGAVDVHRFERLVGHGRDRLAAGDPAGAGHDLRTALELWRGEPLCDIGDVPLRDRVRPRLEELRLQALEARIEADLAAGGEERLAAELVGLLGEHPLREGLAALQMRVLAATGRRGDALAVYEQTRARLAEELGTDPGGELARHHLAILRDEPPAPATATPTETECPAGGDSLPLPPLAPTPDPYVGRADLLERLRVAWTGVHDDGGARCALLVGEPGVGKTRTAAELAAAVHEKGGRVLIGRCDEELSAPYQPFVEALDWQTRTAPGLPLGRLPGELARLLGDLPRRIADLPEPVGSDPQGEQHRLFEAVTSWLAEMSRPTGLLLVLDDLHWASPPTLQLLRHVLRGVAADRGGRLLVVTTHRDTDVDDAHPLRSTLGQLRRLAPVDELVLTGLTQGETQALIEQVAGHDLDDHHLLDLVHGPTRGNPFFATELLGHLVDTGAVRLEDGRWALTPGAAPDVPAGVRDVVAHRLDRLSTTTNELLRVASLMIGDADVAVLGELTDGGIDGVLDAVEEALAGRLVEPTATDAVRFTHGIVRDTVADTLSAARRRRLHGRIADALEVVRPTRTGELAHHAALAAPIDGRWERAVRHTLGAGDQALARRAVADARHWFEQAIALLDACTEPDEHLRLRARCGLGECQRDQGDAAFRVTLLQVSRDALAADHLDLAARAALANSRLNLSRVGAVDRERVEVLERLSHSGSGLPPAHRVRLAALLAAELTFDPAQVDRRLRLADEAVEAAEDIGDPVLTAWARTTTAIALTIPDRIEGLPAHNARAARLADRAGDPPLAAMARFNEAEALLAVGDITAARSRAEDAAALARDECSPVVQWMTRTLTVQFSAYDGDLEAARAQNAGCLELGQQLDEPDAAAWWGGIESVFAVLDGSLPGLVEPLREHADGHPDMPIWRIGQALALAQGDRHAEARDLLTTHGLLRVDDLPVDWLQLSALAMLAATAHELSLPDLGASLLPVLEAHRGRWAHIALCCVGPVELMLGLAAAAAGHWDRAVVEADRGRRLLSERGLVSHGPLASLYLAQVLLGRACPGDRAAAHRLAREGAAVASDLGMSAILARFDGVVQRAA